MKAKNDKLGAADREIERKKALAQKEIDDAIQAEKDAEMAKVKAEEDAVKKKANYEKMMNRFKKKVRELMWAKLKE